MRNEISKEKERRNDYNMKKKKLYEENMKMARWRENATKNISRSAMIWK